MSKKKKFTTVPELLEDVKRCRQCFGTEKILVPTPDDLPENVQVRVLVLGEQPDRAVAMDAGKSGIIRTDFGILKLRDFLVESGIETDEILFSTAVLCVPESEKLRDGRPSSVEIKNCTRHLSRLIKLVKPKVILPLGHTAVQSLQIIYKEWTELRQFILNYDIGKVLEQSDLAIYPLYHTSALKSRPADVQRRDWQRIPGLLETLERRAT